MAVVVTTAALLVAMLGLVGLDLWRYRNAASTDANGTRYTYQVFKKQVVGPTAFHVTQPVPGRSVITLQTCTLPDYAERLIVQAELTSVA